MFILLQAVSSFVGSHVTLNYLAMEPVQVVVKLKIPGPLAPTSLGFCYYTLCSF